MDTPDTTNSNTQQHNYYYVLGWQQANTKVAILARDHSGPVLAHNRQEMISIRTNLLNDPRASQNTHAQQIIQKLRIYKLSKRQTLIWRPGDLWIYLDQKVLIPVETV